MAAAELQSAVEPWGVTFTSEGIAAFEQAGVQSPDAAKDYVLSADLRRLHLAPHPADHTGFNAILSKSLNAPPEVAAYATTNQPSLRDESPALKFSLKKPVLCMVLSFQDVRLPTKDVEEDFSGGFQGIWGNQRRLLSLKLTDGRGASFTGVELRFCPQLDAVPLLPGVKLLLLPGLVLYRGMALLRPEYVQNLGGGAAQLREAFNLKADVEERRKLVQHILKENTQLQQRIKADKGDTGPPKFAPFSFSARVQPVEVRPVTATKEMLQQKALPPREALNGQAPSPTQPCGGTPAEPVARSVLIDANTGDLKHDRLKQLEKLNPNTVGADRIANEKKPGRGGRARRERRGRDEDLAEYMRPSGCPVTYTLFDLIKADAEQTNSTAATTLLCASESFVKEGSVINAPTHLSSAFPSAFRGAGGLSHSATTRESRGTTDAPRRGAPRDPPRAGNSTAMGHRGGGRGRGRGRGRGTR